MGCNSCMFLDTSLRKEGKLNGCMYYCKKHKKYVTGCEDSCSEYYKDYSSKISDINEIYKEGKNYYDDTTPAGMYLIYLVLFITLSIFQMFM